MIICLAWLLVHNQHFSKCLLNKNPPVNGCSTASCDFGAVSGADEHTSFYSTILNWKPHKGFDLGRTWMWELDCEEGWAPKNWCFDWWRRLLRVPWTARRSNQSILKISHGISLEGMMIKLKLQYFGLLMRRVDSLEKIDARRDWG